MADGLRAREDGRFTVDGALTIERVPEVLDPGARLLAAAATAGGVIDVDLSGLAEFDSAALGVLFEWQRRVAASGSTVRYSNLPPKLDTLARLYGVEALLVPARNG
jgi:phospholipid transport system transporter-binding protein